MHESYGLEILVKVKRSLNSIEIIQRFCSSLYTLGIVANILGHSSSLTISHTFTPQTKMSIFYVSFLYTLVCVVTFSVVYSAL